MIIYTVQAISTKEIVFMDGAIHWNLR